MWTLLLHLAAGKGDKSRLSAGRSPSFVLGRLGGQSRKEAGLGGQGFPGTDEGSLWLAAS